MNAQALLALGTLLLVPSAARPMPATTRAQEAPQAEAARASVRRGDFERSIELDGRFVPGEADELELWTEAYSGELLWLEVRPHGTYVNAGDVVGRIETRTIEEQLASARLDLRAAELDLEAAAAQAEIDAEAAAASEAQAAARLARARRDLEGQLEIQLDLERRGDELSASYTQDGIEDQIDELAQLEAMYRDDELVDATEDIVLQRSRRQLARSRASQELSADRRAFERDYARKSRLERLHEAVAEQEGSLDRLRRSNGWAQKKRELGLERTAHALGEKRARLERLQEERELLTLRAPRAGVLLHGGLESYQPGQTRPTHARGGQAARRKALFTLADPDRLALAGLLPESKLSQARQGMSVRVHPEASDAREVVGALHYESYPSAGSSAAPEAQYEARVELEQPVQGLVVGSRAKLELVVEALEGVLLLPAAAVSEEGGAHCWADTGGGQFERVALELGPRNGGEVVVHSGLKEGQAVLLGEPR